MYFKLSAPDQNDLLSKPETGMGYQVIEATDAFNYSVKNYIVLNSQIAIVRGSSESSDISKIMNIGFSRAKDSAEYIHLRNIKVLNEIQFRGLVNEPLANKGKAAIDSPKENADGFETFVRLSAFENDLRIDRDKMCLRPGSFTTTPEDYMTCKVQNDDPVQRYALPSNDEIKWAFYITPLMADILQRGTVQPAYEKRGRGKEVYFENGTSSGTFVRETKY